MSNRDEDRTLIDIRFAHDVLDPTIAPEAFAEDLVDPSLVTDLIDEHNHMGMTTPSGMTLSGVAGFVGGLLIIAVLYVAWVWFLSVV